MCLCAEPLDQLTSIPGRAPGTLAWDPEKQENTRVAKVLALHTASLALINGHISFQSILGVE